MTDEVEEKTPKEVDWETLCLSKGGRSVLIRRKLPTWCVPQTASRLQEPERTLTE